MPDQSDQTAPRLLTARLELVAADLRLARADLDDACEFSRLLDAEIPDGWPPPLNDRASKLWAVEFLEKNPDAAGWAAWYLVWRGPTRVAVGMSGFKGPPAGGIVEIGYCVLPEFQRRGFALEAVEALVGWALARREVERVAAETLPSLKPSLRVLRKLGFRKSGKASQDGAIRFERRRRG